MTHKVFDFGEIKSIPPVILVELFPLHVHFVCVGLNCQRNENA